METNSKSLVFCDMLLFGDDFIFIPPTMHCNVMTWLPGHLDRYRTLSSFVCHSSLKQRCFRTESGESQLKPEDKEEREKEINKAAEMIHSRCSKVSDICFDAFKTFPEAKITIRN